MKVLRPLILLIACLVIFTVLSTEAYMRVARVVPASPPDPPVANDDSYTKHGGGTIGPLLANDSGPAGMTVDIVTQPTHGILFGLDGNSFSYQLNNNSFIGTDTFTYKACAAGACSNVATVTITMVNGAPVGNPESYNVHGTAIIGPMLANDSDPDGDPLTWVFLTPPSQGTLFGLPNPYANDFKGYSANNGYTGTDSFTYKACDPFQLCSAPVTVTLNITNNPPVPGPDQYVVPSAGIIGPMFANDFDPEGDSFNGPEIVVGAANGTVFGLSNTDPPDFKLYVGNTGFIGTDTFQYRITDFLGASGTTTVTLYVVGDGVNDGAASCSARIGEPVNVTNGNMYLQQNDYKLPGVGQNIDLTRTYNSNSQRIGLFGRGWSTAYDESIISYDSSLLRFNQADGRAIYFGRAVGSSGAFTPLVGDFHAVLTQDANGFTLSMIDGSVHQFNSAGKLISLADRIGNQTTLTYDTGGKLTSVTDSFGRVLSFTPNGNGQVLSISDTIGTVATYTYNGNQLFSVTYPDNSAFQFAYNANFRLTTVTDALGNIVESHTYDGQGRALTSERQGGVEHYSLNYVSATETDVTDALGHVTKYTIDKSKGRNVVTRVEGLCNCGGSGSQVQTWTYDNQLNVTARTDALNHTTTFTYDGNGNRLTETDATGTVTYTYNQFAEVLTRTDQMSGVTTNTYDAQGNLLTTKDALNNTTTFTYNTPGQLLTATDARGKVTTFSYDNSGNLTQRQDANNIITFFFYDARSRLTKMRDGLSRDTLYAYDAAGRLNKVTHPDFSFVTFAYDLGGRRTIATDERGNATNYAYDSAYRLTAVTDALSHETGYGYDEMSNLTTMSDALSRVTNYEYDDFNRLKKTIYPPATTGATRLFETLTYDAAGNVMQRTDRAGRITSYTYDSLNRMASTTHADGTTTGFQYDALSRVTGVLDGLGQQYEFAYDAVGRQTQITRGGVSMSHAYDAVGNRSQRTDYNGTVTNYAYDNLNRLTTITYPNRTATYAYDPLNNLTQATNENGSVNISYDNRYRVSTVMDPFNYGVSYNYDTAGNRTNLSLNYSTYATYTYDPVNRLTDLKDAANQSFPHSYDAANRLTSRGAPNGVTSNDAYDGLSRLTALTHMAGATTLISNQYSYNDASNITNWTNAAGAHDYEYDPVNRLLVANNSAEPNENYSYDEVGNRRDSHLSGRYAYEPFNKLIQTDTNSYTYDANGNLIAKVDAEVATNFIWSEENQLTQVVLPNRVVVSYKYDALGRRIQRTSNGGENERYVYDGQDVLLDLNADWSVATTYLNAPGIDNHLRQTSATTGVRYYLTDHLGSTVAMTDTTGNIVEQLTYDSFGNSTGNSLTRYTYTGREFDPDTGLMYYRARWYDPQVGRFISEDPIGLSGGINPFAYVHNAPINNTDPMGLEANNPWWHPRSWFGAFNEGGIFSGGTLTEFITANHRSTQPCKKFGERFSESFSETNAFLPGALAPTGAGVATSKKLAEISGEPTPFRWARNGFRPGSASGGVITRLGLNFLAVGGAWESGVAIGSFVDAAGCPCGY
jgi:RHS repeat-associated protein